MIRKLLDDLVSLEQTSTLKYIGIKKRLGATIIDSLILLFLIGMIGMGCGFLFMLSHLIAFDATEIISKGVVLSILVILFYFSIWESSKEQGTWGKQIIGIKVVNKVGERLSFGHALLRFLFKIVSLMSFFLGFVIIKYTPKRQGLHDIICKTYIIKNERKIYTKNEQ